MTRRRQPLDPYTREPREALELITMLVGAGAMRDPTQSHGTAPTLTSLDVAQALAHARDDLGELMAMALACSMPQLRAQVVTLALPELIGAVQACSVGAPLIRGARRYRARVVLHHAFDELLYPTRAIPYREAARSLRMRRGDYLWLCRQACGLLDNRARAAASAARAAISSRVAIQRPADDLPPRRRPRTAKRTTTTAPVCPAPTPAPTFQRWGVLSLRRRDADPKDEVCSSNAGVARTNA